MRLQYDNVDFCKNASWMIAGKLIQMVLSLMIGMISARYLGPTNYGIINYTASIIAFFTSVCTLGINGIIVKELMDNPSEQGIIIGTSIGIRLISSSISIVAILLSVNLLNPNDLSLLIVSFLQSLSLFFQAFDIIAFWYQSKLQSKVTAIIQLIAYSVMSAYRVILLILHRDIKWFAFALTLDVIIVTTLLLYEYFRHRGPIFAFSWAYARYLLGKSHYFIISGLLVAIYGKMDKIMIGKMIDQASVGLYSSAVYVCTIWTFVLGAIIDSARPLIVEAKNYNPTLYVLRLKQLYAVILWVSLFVSLFISFFARKIVYILYGPNYIEATISLRIVSWYTAFSFLGVARNIWIVCENKHKYVKVFALWGVVSNLTLNFILIPIWGINGAALATLITQILTGFIIPLFFREARENSRYIAEALILKGVFQNSSTGGVN